MTRHISLLGSTGSIGTQACQIISAHPEKFTVQALAAGGSNLPELLRQAQEFRPELIAVARGDVSQLREEIWQKNYRPEIITGPKAAIAAAACGADVVLNGITGSIGLAPTLAALDKGSTLALANKESLIVGGSLVTKAAKPGQIVPIDSEHSAIAQCLAVGKSADVRRLIVTASGGPFRGMSRSELMQVTPKQALAHPTWDMGLVVTTNSATLVNKGLEVIEAHLLFDVPFSQIEVVVHPQSIVHSLVEYVDGSTIAQVSPPTMLIPIALGLDWPQRIENAGPAMDWTSAQNWEFFPLDDEAFPAVALARQVGQEGATYPAVYNAANEQCVAAFHAGKIPFPAIVEILQQVVDQHEPPNGNLDIAQVLTAETWARTQAEEEIACFTS